MKKLVFSILSIFSLQIAFSQTEFGLKGGMNIANVKTAGIDDTKNRIGYHTGGMLQWNLEENFFLNTELLFSVKGCTAPATQDYGEFILSLNYISLPVLFGFRATPVLSFLSGPEFSYLTSARSKFDGNNINVSDAYNRFDWGINLSASYKLTRSFGFDVRYNYGFEGLMDIEFTDQNGNTIGRDKAGANRVLQIGFFYITSR